MTFPQLAPAKPVTTVRRLLQLKKGVAASGGILRQGYLNSPDRQALTLHPTIETLYKTVRYYNRCRPTTREEMAVASWLLTEMLEYLDPQVERRANNQPVSALLEEAEALIERKKHEAEVQKEFGERRAA